MGIKNVRVKIYRPDRPSVSKDAGELIIDTGSVATWVPSRLLRALKISPEQKPRKFQTIDGKVLQRRWGTAAVEIQGKRGSAMVIFAEKGDKHVLGVTALESAGWAVNPDPRAKKPLIEAEMLAL